MRALTLFLFFGTLGPVVIAFLAFLVFAIFDIIKQRTPKTDYYNYLENNQDRLSEKEKSLYNSVKNALSEGKYENQLLGNNYRTAGVIEISLPNNIVLEYDKTRPDAPHCIQYKTRTNQRFELLPKDYNTQPLSYLIKNHLAEMKIKAKNQRELELLSVAS